jgi:hypothetical protein
MALIYQVTNGSPSYRTVHGTFSSYEKAKNYVDAFHKTSYLVIESHPLDVKEIPEGHMAITVKYDKEGNDLNYAKQTEHALHLGIQDVYVARDKSLYVSVIAKDANHAKTKANAIITLYKANKDTTA